MLISYGVDEEVTIRSWNSMKNEFGCDRFGSIRTSITFLEGMRDLCGASKRIGCVLSKEDAATSDGWFISPDMVVGGGIFRQVTV